jgi:uncharacterized membrane protein YkoI
MQKLSLPVLCLVALLGTGPAMADRDDHERARAALERGEVLPLATLLERLEGVIDGDIIATDFERDDGRWIYEIEYIDRNGRVVELEVDAADGSVLKREVD